MKILVVLITLLLSGCGLMYQGMSPASIAAEVKDKNATATCVQLIGTGGKFSTLYINADKGVVQTAGGSATIECDGSKATFTDGGKVVQPPKGNP